MCLSYVPYYRQPEVLSLEKAKTLLKKYFSLADTVDKFSITGGEPLTNTEIVPIVEEIYRYKRQITGKVIFITNGTIGLPEELIQIWKKHPEKTKIIINDYGNGLSGKAEENYKRLCEEGLGEQTLLYTEENRYGWIDCRAHDQIHFTEEAIVNLPSEQIVDVSSSQEKESREKLQESSSGGVMSQEEIEAMLAGAQEEPSADVQEEIANTEIPEQPSMNVQQPYMNIPPMAGGMPAGSGTDMSMMQMQMMQQMMQQMQAMQQQLDEQKKAPEPKMINVQSSVRPNLTPDREIVLEGEQEENMELIMGVPLEISVEIGRTRKFVKDILEFTKGSLVVLDKIAGEQVDLFVNGQCIAKGDVVVVEDNFGIRITEIMKVNFSTLE